MPGDFVPVVTEVDGRFRLSDDLLTIVGPLGWGSNLWEVKAFVARLVSHFGDGFEHFLDGPSASPDMFQVSQDFCTALSATFADEFLPLPPSWYHRLAAAKLISLRVPRETVLEAKYAWFEKHHNARVFVFSLRELLLLKNHPSVPEDLDRVEKLSSKLAWEALEATVTRLLELETIQMDELRTLMDLDSVEEAQAFLVRYEQYLKRSRG